MGKSLHWVFYIALYCSLKEIQIMFKKIENLNVFEESLWVWDVIMPLKLVYHV